MNPNTPQPDNVPPTKGFALIATILILAVLVLLITVIASFVTLTQRGAGAQSRTHAAQQSALAGLKVAMGELQAAAGPDQRITASAAILGGDSTAGAPTNEATEIGGTTADPGRQAWTGVWRSNTNDGLDGSTPQYTPENPDSKSFVGWMVSATDSMGNFVLPTDVTDASSSFVLNEPKTLFTSNGVPHIDAGLVQIDDANTPRYFAFTVED